ncbi:MATE family efflux transporter [Holdemanella biformis]|jgi:putative MATE family efflux protein|uniref:MATE family efflux transporter n=1 Tax=Holdemanella biformis TaxID=1735 RepID=UPI001C25926F|nr:MATE family efflux transporter [Holdemanella biformis]MBU9894906.1 MATE family efflux transporter [Holdemanella biformis]MBV3416604.1 MATE family efflux transporter [Holdemanella biformis]
MRSYQVDMCNGPIFKKLIIFAIPLILSGCLQLLFNAADIIVVGRFTGSQALAAVGSTSALINLLVNLFIGISVGANVVLGKYIGARDDENASKTVHTAIFISIVGGILMIFIGVFFSKPLLQLMATPEDVIDLSSLYMRIYFVGMPFFMLYNFGAAILRSIGDTKRPLYFLLISGIINVVFNLFFVIVLHMGVAGVALATMISEGISAGLILLCLKHMDGPLHFELKNMRFHKDLALKMLEVGLPAGLQGIIFSISNVLIQSSVNSFGSVVMAGNTAASNIEGFVYTSMNAVYQTSLSFTSQNFGAKKFDRIDKILIECLGIVALVGLVLGQGAYFFGQQLLSIYTNDRHVIQYGIERLSVIAATYCLCGMMDTLVGSLRGVGYSILPMLVSLTGVCVFRVIWIFTVFKSLHTQFSLYVSYPISWTITIIAHMLCFLVVRKRIRKEA